MLQIILLQPALDSGLPRSVMAPIAHMPIRVASNGGPGKIKHSIFPTVLICKLNSVVVQTFSTTVKLHKSAKHIENCPHTMVTLH